MAAEQNRGDNSSVDRPLANLREGRLKKQARAELREYLIQMDPDPETKPRRDLSEEQVRTLEAEAFQRNETLLATVTQSCPALAEYLDRGKVITVARDRNGVSLLGELGYDSDGFQFQGPHPVRPYWFNMRLTPLEIEQSITQFGGFERPWTQVCVNFANMSPKHVVGAVLRGI